MGLEEEVGEVWVGGYWQFEGMETLSCNISSVEYLLAIGSAW